MERDVKAVAQLSRARVGPEREADLLLRASLGIHEEVHEQLAWARRSPCGALDGPIADEDLQRPKCENAKTARLRNDESARGTTRGRRHRPMFLRLECALTERCREDVG